MPQWLELGKVNQLNLRLIPFWIPRAQMQRSQVQLLSTMIDELAFAGAPRPALAPLTALRSELSKRDPSHFNDAETFKAATAKALDVQNEARLPPRPLFDSPATAILMTQILHSRRSSCCSQKKHRGRVIPKKPAPRKNIFLHVRSSTNCKSR